MQLMLCFIYQGVTCVKEIEEKAFSGCHSLNKIKLPETLESICDNLFDKLDDDLYKKIDDKINKLGIEFETFLVGSKISKDIGDNSNHVSKYLKSLKEADLVVCLNEEDNRYRFYSITDKGSYYLKQVKDKYE